jgi:predicted NUDIX family phosphoesterase
MGVFLDAAYRILQEAKTPLSARQIAEDAVDRGYLVSNGRTPWQTMKSKLSTDILKRGSRSPFMRSGQGRFALREWETVDEYVADRYKKALFDEDILVFPRHLLDRYAPRPGLHFTDLSSLIRKCHAMKRADAEADTSVIQLVSAFIVRHLGLVLTHKRTKRLPESRLHGFYSLNFGGHLNPDDLVPLFSPAEPAQWAPWLLRELREELVLRREQISRMTFRGLLYDDAREVSKQHVGVTYEVEIAPPTFTIGERGFLIDAKFETLVEIRQRANEFENWSIRLLEAMEAEWGA